MGSLVLLFSDVCGLSLSKVLSQSQLKCGLCMCISWCFPWALSRESAQGRLGPHPCGVSICLLLLVLPPAGLPPRDWGRQGGFLCRALPLLGGGPWKQGESDHFQGAAPCMWGVGDCLRAKPGMASVVLWLGHPSGLAWQHGSPELDKRWLVCFTSH